MVEADCPFEGCNQPIGHDGPHGLAAAPGVVLAPYGGGEGSVGDWEPCLLECDCCRAPMRQRRFETGGGEFACTKCDQAHSFYPDGTHTRAIIARMYPSKMNRRHKLWREAVEYRLRQWSFTMTAKCLLALVTKDEADRSIANATQQVVDELAALPRDIKWWRFW